MTKHLILVVGGKGGIGKTTITLGIAGRWAIDYGPIEVRDCDPQDEGSAERILDHTQLFQEVPPLNPEDPPTYTPLLDNEGEPRFTAPDRLFWKGQPIRETIETCQHSDNPTVIIDSPGFDAEGVRKLAALADVIVLPVPLYDVRSSIQTAVNIRGTTDAPILPIGTLADQSQWQSTEGLEQITELEANGLAPAGYVYRISGLGWAKKRAPYTLPHQAPISAQAKQINGLFAGIVTQIRRALTTEGAVI